MKTKQRINSSMNTSTTTDFLINSGTNDPLEEHSLSIPDEYLERYPMHHAFVHGELGTVKYFIEEKGVDPNLRDMFGRSALYLCKHASLELVRYLVDKGAKLDIRDKEGRTPFHLAVMFNRFEIIKYLIEEKGVDPNVRDSIGRSASNFIQYASLETVRYLAAKGTDFNTKDMIGNTAIHSALCSLLTRFYRTKEGKFELDNSYPISILYPQKLEVIKYLVEEKGLDSNLRNNIGTLPLHICSQISSAEYFLEKGADLNARDDFGDTTLHYSLQGGHWQNRTNLLLEYLIDIGADVGVKNNKNMTPLLIAQEKKYYSAVKLLLEREKDPTIGRKPIHNAARHNNVQAIKYLLNKKGVSPDECDKDGLTPLHYAAIQGNLEAVKVLVILNAKINAQYITHSRAPLHEAVYCGKLDVIRFLVSVGADIYIRDKYGITPLGMAKASKKNGVVKYLDKIDAGYLIGKRAIHFAAEENSVEAIQYLLDKERGILDERDNNGLTPLHYAAALGNLAVVKKLVDEGADLNVQYFTERRTPLHEAAYCGKLDVVRFLVSSGADVNIQDKHGITPLRIAAAAGNYGIVEYLRQKGGIDLKSPNTVEKPLHRKQRHHHGDHDYHHVHLPRKLLSIEQPEVVASSGTRPSSWINGLFGWITSSIGGLLGSKYRETPSTSSIISQVDAQKDINGTILLLDMLIRKFTGQKYVSTVGQSISLLEARCYALNITEEFEKAVKEDELKSGVLMNILDIDFVKIYKEVTRKIISGNFDEIPGILSSCVEKVCPDRGAECTGKLSPKKFDKFVAEFNKGMINQSTEKILHNGDSRSEVDGAKQMNLEPQSYFSNASVHSHSEVSTCLSEIGITKLGGNLNR